jgi:antitoxin component YwqK of YwqJK toxin-antitoxin module
MILFSCGENVKTGYYRNGKKSWELHIKEEKPDGFYTEWDSLGNMTQLTEYKMGVRVGKSSLWTKGRLTVREYYTNGQTDSLLRIKPDCTKYIDKYFPQYHYSETWPWGKLSMKRWAYERVNAGKDSLRTTEMQYENGKCTRKIKNYWGQKPSVIIEYTENDSSVTINIPEIKMIPGRKITYYYKDGSIKKKTIHEMFSETTVSYSGKDSNVVVINTYPKNRTGK